MTLSLETGAELSARAVDKLLHSNIYIAYCIIYCTQPPLICQHRQLYTYILSNSRKRSRVSHSCRWSPKLRRK